MAVSGEEVSRAGMAASANWPPRLRSNTNTSGRSRATASKVWARSVASATTR